MPVMPPPVCTSSRTNSASCSWHSSCMACRNSARMWLSPPSPWIGSAMKQAMSCGCAANAARACASARCLGRPATRSTSQREVDRRHVDARPVELREAGRSCAGRCWSATACSRCGRGRPCAGAAPWCPSSAGRPCASLCRRFQSNAVFSAFSTASAPPSTKNRCGSAGSPSTRANVSTNSASCVGVDVGVGRLVDAPPRPARPGRPGRRPAPGGSCPAARRRRS